MNFKAVMVVFVTLVAGAGPSFADGKKTTITEEQAKVIALKAVPGKVLEVEKEKHSGEPVYSVEIRGADGTKKEVIISIATGTILEQKIDKDDDEDEDK